MSTTYNALTALEVAAVELSQAEDRMHARSNACTIADSARTEAGNQLHAAQVSLRNAAKEYATRGV
jgi:hypothetical protein